MLLLIVFALLTLVGTILYLIHPDERARLAQLALERTTGAVRQLRSGGGTNDPLQDMLVSRTKWPIVAPLLAAACVWIWGATFFAGEPALQWQIAWGASYAPRTTQGEWWRLVTFSFVPGGFLQLVATVAALLSLGVVLERLVGRVAFAAVYLVSAIAVGVVALWTRPATTAVVGASGAVSGLYGLLIAVAVYGYLRPPRLPWSPLAAKRLAAGAAPFVLYSLFAATPVRVGELAGLGTGLLLGLSLARRTGVRKPRVQRSILVPASVTLLVLATAVPLRGTIDVRPELARIADIETRTSIEYAQASFDLTQGRRQPKALVQIIDKSILPALKADRERVQGLRGVPHEQKPLVDAARNYFDLRERSWRRRQAGLASSNVKLLREADQAEREALGAFEHLQRSLGTRQTAVMDLPASKTSPSQRGLLPSA